MIKETALPPHFVALEVTYKKSQLPSDLRPSSLEGKRHPDTQQVVNEVNDFFISKWPFPSEKHVRRFVEEGYAWFVCINCPLSLPDRMHWGCKLLTTGFLIDDMLDRMSVEDGVKQNDKIIECCKGTTQPDRSNMAESIMYDLFEGMRAVDKTLADELLRPTIDFLIAQVDKDRNKPMSLEQYFLYRDADLGKGLLSGIMRFCAGLHMTEEELELVKPAEENAMKHITFVNDICSFEKEKHSAEEGYELGAICSSVPIMIDVCTADEEETKRVMWQMVRAWEAKHFELVDAILAKKNTPELVKYLKGLEHQAAGNEIWSLKTPRYNHNGSMAFKEGR